jgi:hypothetical protein
VRRMMVLLDERHEKTTLLFVVGLLATLHYEFSNIARLAASRRNVKCP